MSLLNERTCCEDNLVLILEISSKLIKFEGISSLKRALTKMFVTMPSQLHSHDKDTLQRYRKALICQEIIVSILQNEKMMFIGDFLKNEFPLYNALEDIDESIANVNKIQESDKSIDEHDYDDLKDSQY